jgi:Ca2+-binding RTX toxin-like protein
VDFVGTDGADSQTGGADGQSFVAGHGNDTANGGAFNDLSFRMGTGDDVVVANGNARVIDGGAGFDMWAPTQAELDLTVNMPIIQNTEAIGLSADDILLTVGLLQLFGIAETTPFLRVDGEAGDSVTVTDGTWTLEVVDNYDVFTTGALPSFRLEILNNSGMTANVPTE